MALIPTTFLRHPDFSKEMLRGVANAQMGILLNQMRLGNLNCGRRVVEFASGVQIICAVNYRDRHFDIIVPPDLGGENISEEYVVGFICHPATDGVYDQVQELIEDRKDNKVIWYDNKATKWFSQDYVTKVTTTDLFGNIINITWKGNEYGNVDWKGPVQPNDPTQRTRRILTWKGPPSRYWPLDQFADISGVTVTDHVIEGSVQDTRYYTPFSGNVYEHGLIACTMPNLYYPLGLNEKWSAQVLGAAYREVDGKLVVVVKTCYNAYPRLKLPQQMVSTWQVRSQYPDKPWFFYQEWLADKDGADKQATSLNSDEAARYALDKTYVKTKYEVFEVPDPGRGYWLEVLLQEPGESLSGWHRLLRVFMSGNMPNTNWFFSEDGTKAVTVMYDYLHKITLSQDINGVTACDYTTESVGKFEVGITTAASFVQTNEAKDISDTFPLLQGNDGTYLESFFAWQPGSPEYARVVIPLLGKYGQVDTYNASYNDIKSGKIIIAADYQKNNIVTLEQEISGHQTAARHSRFTTQRKGRAAWLRSWINWQTLETLYGCACRGHEDNGYRFVSADEMYDVYYCATQLSAAKPIYTPGTLASFMEVPYGDGYISYSYTAFNDMQVAYAGGIIIAYVVGAMRESNSGLPPAPLGVNAGIDAAHFEYYGPVIPGTEGRWRQPYFGVAGGVVCTTVLSSSWLTGLVDNDGNELIIPSESEDGYLIQPTRVMRKTCKYLT